MDLLLPVQRLLHRLRQPTSRADDLDRLARALSAPPSAASDEARAAARELARAKLALSEALAGVRACGRCARGHPLPHGRFDGGHCCGARTDELFTDDELAALRLAGTTFSRLVPPRGEHAGCAFRGSSGCSLAPAHRPTLCVRYVCRELDAELRERPDGRAPKRLAQELRFAFERFVALRRADELPVE